MFHSTAFDASTKLPAAAGGTFAGLPDSWTLPVRTNERWESVAIDELTFRMAAAFRVHPHISNVLTHISGGDWLKIERALGALFDLSQPGGRRSPIEANLLDLMCAERGVTGRIMKPYTGEVLSRIVGPRLAELLIQNLTGSFNSHQEQRR